jgi:hypothetical protein
MPNAWQDHARPYLQIQQILKRTNAIGSHELNGKHPLMRILLTIGTQADHIAIADDQLDDDVPKNTMAVPKISSRVSQSFKLVVSQFLNHLASNERWQRSIDRLIVH